jgi:hypothetical protein
VLRSVLFHAKSKFTFIYIFFVGGLFADDDDSEEESSDDEPENHLVNQWLPLGRKS